MNTSQNISQLIPSQLPSYIVDDPSYSNFVAFFQAYYEWMGLENNSLYGSKNLLNYIDIDKTTNDFLQYFSNDFLQYFPKDSLIDKSSAIKIARELYKSKGTPASYQFLFRILFDSDFDIFYTKDAVLKASDGIWYVAKSLKLATTDPAFLSISNLKIFGETSKSTALIENSVLAGIKTSVFISNIERSFQSGEFVKIIDGNNQDVLVDNQPLRAKLVGQINQIKIDPKNRGLFYRSGDPVVVYGGLNSSVINPIGATAKIGKTTSGSIQRINVNNGGFGYNVFPFNNPYSSTLLSLTNAPGAIAHVSSVTDKLPPVASIINGGSGYLVNDYVIKGNTSNYVIFADVTSVDVNGSILGITYRNGLDPNLISGITANVVSRNENASDASIKISSILGKGIANATYIVQDTINKKVLEVHTGHENGYLLGNTSNPISYHFNKMPTANINTQLSDAFTFEQFSTYSISSVIVDNGGGNISALPDVTASSIYLTDVWDPQDSANTLGQNIQGRLENLGILAPIQIISSGTGYRENDRIILLGGSGYGASANVISVDSSGAITSVDYVYPTNQIQYPLGGMGYKSTSIPTVTIQSANSQAYGAQLIVPGILGTGASFSLSVDRVGEVETIDILNFGEDYITTPNVSLRVQDIVVSNVYLNDKPKQNDIVYQGSTVNTATYIASVDSLQQLTVDADQTKSLYSLRVYNYTSNPKPELPLKILNNSIELIMDNTAYANNAFYTGSPEFDSNGIKTYGDGTAKATASFLNGLNISQGQYLTTKGHPSAFSVLQNENYNNYTYQITVETEIAKYRDILLNLLHPTGMKIIGRYAIKSNSNFIQTANSSFQQGSLLVDYTQNVYSYATMSADWINKSNNIVQFYNLNSKNLNSIFSNSSILTLTPSYGRTVKSEVISVDYTKNTVTLKDNVWLTFANVAYANGNIESNTLYVKSITNSYDIINNGNYSNTQNKLQDIVFSGDKLKINNDVYTINSVNYNSNIITLTTNLLSTVNNLISINRTLSVGGSVSTETQILISDSGLIEPQYLVTEDLSYLSTENNYLIALG
jgi:hypothetical protein